MKNEAIKKQIEQARRKYLPEKVTMLLVGEAPPDALNRFFYYENVKDKDFFIYRRNENFGIRKCDFPLYKYGTTDK